MKEKIVYTNDFCRSCRKKYLNASNSNSFECLSCREERRMEKVKDEVHSRELLEFGSINKERMESDLSNLLKKAPKFIPKRNEQTLFFWKKSSSKIEESNLIHSKVWRWKMTGERTWIDAEELSYNIPLSDSQRKGLVIFPNGKLKKVRLGVPDTYFTIPARATISVNNRSVTVHGFVSLKDGEYHFTPMGKNKNVESRRNVETMNEFCDVGNQSSDESY